MVAQGLLVPSSYIRMMERRKQRVLSILGEESGDKFAPPGAQKASCQAGKRGRVWAGAEPEEKEALVPQGLDSVLGQSNPLWQAGWPKISSKLI